jgi:hypothetical protein
MKDEFENALLSSGELVKKSCKSLVSNMGRVIAILTVIVAALVLFTDVGLSSPTVSELTPTLMVMLIASYVIYFSLEDAGEHLGEDTEEYRDSKKRYNEFSRSIGGDMIPSLREFCKEYSEKELKYRRENLLLSYGYSYSEYEDYKNGIIREDITKRERRVFLYVDSLRAVELSPRVLLTPEKMSRKSELENPENSKLVKMILALIPTSICMIITVSIMLTMKDTMTAADVIEAIFKLATLLIIGLRGYVSGYNYKKHTIPLWNDTKSRLLDAFGKSRALHESKIPDTKKEPESEG